MSYYTIGRAWRKLELPLCLPVFSSFGDYGKLGCDEVFLKALTKPNDLDDCLAAATKVFTHPVGTPAYSDIIT